MLHELPTDRFVRLNKSIIVNYSKIEKVERHIIYMQDQQFKLSRTYSMQMMEILNQRDSF
jgi:DNA-binding LytR/AlgR family response regulator